MTIDVVFSLSRAKKKSVSRSPEANTCNTVYLT